MVNIDLEENEPRLVVDASIYKYKDALHTPQLIKLSLTSGFYEENNPPVKDAHIKIQSETGESYEFIHQNNGIYINDNFMPKIGEKYSIQINYNGETFSGNEIMQSVTNINNIEQSQQGGFSADDYELKVYYTDPIA